MASEYVDKITTRYSVLPSQFVSNLEDFLEWNILYTQSLQVQIAAEMSKLQKEPAQLANQIDLVVSLHVKDQELAEIIDEEMTHWEQMSLLSWTHIQQVEEVHA